MTRVFVLAGLIVVVAAAPSAATTRHCPTIGAKKVTAIGTTCGDALALIHDYHAHEPACRPLGIKRSICTLRGSRHLYRCTVVYADGLHKVSCVAIPPRARGARVRFTDSIGDEGRYPYAQFRSGPGGQRDRQPRSGPLSSDRSVAISVTTAPANALLYP